MKWDEVRIVKALLDKYRTPDNALKMAKDIKVNYLQWSIGQVRDKINSYFALKYDKVPDRMDPNSRKVADVSSDEESSDSNDQ